MIFPPASSTLSSFGQGKKGPREDGYEASAVTTAPPKKKGREDGRVQYG